MLSYMLSQYAGATCASIYPTFMAKTMVVRAGIEVYRQKFLGAISWRETGLCQEYFYNENSKLMESNFLLAPVIRGGNINKPFIDIVGMDSDLNHTALELISKEWSQLRAQYVRILVPGQSFPQGIPDQYIYATSFLNPLNSMINLLLCKWRHTKILTGVVRLWAMPISIHGRQFANCLQTILVAVDDEELCDHISEREVYIIYENDVRAGLLICQKGNIAFLRGYRITDKVILPVFRGRSLSARAQRLLYRLLTHSDSELSLYMGTIIPENIPR